MRKPTGHSRRRCLALRYFVPLWVLFMFCVQTFAGAVPGLAAEPLALKSDAEIEALRDKIAASRERVIAHEQQERGLLRLLEEMDRALAGLREDVRLTGRRATTAQLELTRVEGQRAALDRTLQATRRAMAKRAAALYKTGEIGRLRVIFASSDLQQMLSKMWTLERLLRYDARLAARFQREREALMAIEVEAARALVDRDLARRRLAARRSILEEELRLRRALLERVRSDRSQERNLLVELERARRALEETVSRLGGASLPASALDGATFESLKGQMKQPVPGPIRSQFGRLVDRKYQTETFNNGIEISAQQGESVLAVAQGQVRFAGWFRGYGKIVVLDHGGGYFTVSGHLAEILVDVGEIVNRGDIVGRVGETGSLEGPGLYFELRSGREPQDPAVWLSTG